MLHIKSHFELPVSEENRAVINIVAKELGYDFEAGISTPEEHIVSYFNKFYDGIEATVRKGLQRHYGEAGQTTIDAIMSLYATEVIRDASVTDDAVISEPEPIEEQEEVIEE